MGSYSRQPLVLEGQLCRLRDWELKDLETWKQWHLGNPEWRKTDGPYYPDKPESELNAETEIRAGMIKAGMYEDPRNSLIISSKDEDLLIGTVSCYWIGRETDWLAAGISLYDPGYWGQGIGTEALSLWISYCFRAYPRIVRLDLQTWSGNTAMMRLAEKLGFTLEGRFRKARVVEGIYFDALQYGILREEWTRVKSEFSGSGSA